MPVVLVELKNFNYTQRKVPTTEESEYSSGLPKGFWTRILLLFFEKEQFVRERTKGRKFEIQSFMSKKSLKTRNLLYLDVQ